MIRRLSAAATAALLTIAPPALSNHWMQTADPQVLQAIDEMVAVYGSSCQMGNPQGCQALQYIQQTAGTMLDAGYQCQTMSNAQACAYYQQAYSVLEQAYIATSQAVMQGQMMNAQPGYSAQSHAQRMNEIHQWGQQSLAIGRQNQQILDQRHDQFMEYLRQ